MPSGFLTSRTSRPWNYERDGAEFEYYQGKGTSQLEIAVTEYGERPTKEFLQQTYSDRRGNRANPILVVALYEDSAGICGPSGEDPPIYRDVDRGQAERVCDAALEKPDRFSAQEFLSKMLPQLDEELTGLRNQGLLSTHELRVGVPDREDWAKAAERARGALADDPRDLVKGLNYDIDRLTDQSYVLKDTSDGHERAVAVFLQDDESFDHAQDRFVGQSPVAYALNEADKRNLEYVIGSSDDTLRLYTTNPDAGFGSRGRTDTFVEVNTNLLTDEKAAYLWLLFSANALRDDGTLHEIMEDSKEYAADLGARLRERIYDDVIPDLAEAIAEARDLDDPTKDELDETYRMALVLLYRLLFIAYAEDEGFLPRRRNDRYDQHSLKQKARDLHDFVQDGGEFDAAFSDHWDDVMRLSRAIHHGHDELGLPAYDGRLLSEDPDISEAGALLADIELNNADFGPVLFRLLVDETEEGYQGPVDFRNIGVREFGVIYEGLLESELSVADQPLTLDDEGRYTPVETDGQQTLEDDEDVVVPEGQVYLHGLSGERKATGTYYTKSRFVEHLLDYSLEPALDDHIDRIDRLREEEGDNAAADAFFDFRVSDIAMGSGHFLVGAVDRIESRLYSYLTENPLPPVEAELDNLEDAAMEAFEDEEYAPPVERGQLLRRQVARRCIYGVDLNPLATELARLSIWVHTFVPGLPLTFLDYNLVTGDSLAGIGTLDEVTDILDVEQTSLGMFAGGSSVMDEIREDIDRLGNFADASAEQVEEARETRAEIETKLQEVQARFDVLSASRIDDDIDVSTVSDTNVDITNEGCYARAKEVLRSNQPLHFPAAFPEVFDGNSSGFDVVVGNPPWGKSLIEEHEFWLRYYPGLRRMTQQDRDEAIDELKQERPDLVEELSRQKESKENLGEILRNGPFPGIGQAHPDMYNGFAWRFWRLISESGYVGAVLPRSAFIGDATETLRREILNDGEFLDLTFLRNKSEWAFTGVGARYTISLCSLRKGQDSSNPTIPLRGPYTDSESFEQGISTEPHRFPVTRALDWAGSAKIPLLPSDPLTVDVFDKMEEHPRLDHKQGRWRAHPNQELNSTQDKTTDDGTKVMHFTDDPPSNFWPIYKGESFDIWEPDAGRVYAWTDPDVVKPHLQDKRERSYRYAGSRSPFSEFDEEEIKNPETLSVLSPRIAFRDITKRTNSRTTVAALIPPETPLVHNSPVVLWSSGDQRDEAYLLGLLSSIPLDWYSRRFVEVHLTFGIFNNLPIPRPGGGDPLRQRIVKLSGRLAAVDNRYEGWADAVGVDHGPLDEDKKQEMIYELDAVVAHLYGLKREHVEVIYQTFHDGWDYEERLHRVLDYYAEWADRLDLDHTDREAERASGTRDDD